MEILLVALVIQAVNTVIFIRSRGALLGSNIALRQQLVVYLRRQRRPVLKNRDRLFWIVLSRIWPQWKSALVLVKPETVIRWQKKRFRNFWRKKSKPGRPRINRQHIEFIRRISGDHPEYGEDRIALQLEVKFGIKHSPTTIRRYMVRITRPYRPSQSWKTLLKNQADAIWTCDYCIQYTVRFTALYIFVIMELGSRQVVQVGVTEHPTLKWVKQQGRDKEGVPVRDKGSVTYSAAIESAASRDTYNVLSDFAKRMLREARRRGFHRTKRRVVLGDGARWIWNLVTEHFPDAIQMVDRFHAKQHLSDVAKSIYGVDSDLGEQWAHERHNELDRGWG